MRETTMGWRAAAAAVVFSIMGAGAAPAQNVPAGCSPEGNAGGAAAGALLGGVAGALLGNAVSGRRKAGGTIIGGVTGAAAGAMIGGSQPCPEGYVYREPPRAVDQPVLVRDSGDFWDGAPPSIRERIGFLRHRIERLDSAGWLSPRETQGLSHRLSEIATREEDIRDRYDGHLPPDARDHLNGDLNDVAHRLRWKEYRTQHAEE